MRIACHVIACLTFGVLLSSPAVGADQFEGRFYSGEGDVEYLALLDISRRMFDAEPAYQNAAMLYTPSWNGFVEGPSWNAWWIQNSYGTTYCSLPFLVEPYTTFLINANDLWFRHMGDGRRYYENDWILRHNGGEGWVPPDGALMDCASPDTAIHKQGDGPLQLQDWEVEFTAAGGVMQAELLLISRDRALIDHYMPMLRRAAAFIESRRDPEKNLFLAGSGANLLAPNWYGYRKEDGTYGQAYLTGLSVTYIAFLDRMVELCRLIDDEQGAAEYARQCDTAREGLKQLLHPDGYFIKALDPDGTRHGVYGASRYGYFPAIPNHDAMCFNVVDDEHARRIYANIARIPQLRPHSFIITNYPSVDDMHWHSPFGEWVNGGAWTTCEARMVMGYYRVGAFEDIRRSMRHMMTFADRFQMDNPLKDFGATPWFDKAPVNLCYDSFGLPAAMIRGLFEYRYRADHLELVPRIPPGIRRLEQHFPIRFGEKRLYIATVGQGPIREVRVNGRVWPRFTDESITLRYEELPAHAVIQIALGDGKIVPFEPKVPREPLPPIPSLATEHWRTMIRAIAPTDTPLRIGADSNGGTRFHGEIADVRIYDRALSADEVRQLAGRNASNRVTNGLIGWWRFTGNNRLANGAKNGANLPTAAVVDHVAWTNGPNGGAVRLDGRGFLEVPHHEALNVKECTLAAWVRPEQLPATGARIIDKVIVGTSSGYLLDTYPGNSLRLISAAGSLSVDAQLPVGEWTHVAATISRDGRRALYINGQVVASEDVIISGIVGHTATRLVRLRRFHEALEHAKLGDTYEAAHARLTINMFLALDQRLKMAAQGMFLKLPDASVDAANQMYLNTIRALCDGLEQQLATYQASNDPQKRHIVELWLLSE